MKTKAVVSIATLLFAAAQVALVFLSWLLAAAWPDAGLRSLLSDEGIRWIFGTFAGNVASTPLAWLVLLGVAAGFAAESGMVADLKAWRRPQDSTLAGKGSTFNARVTVALLLAELAIVAGLTLPRHAILLSSLGQLFPSSFSAAVIPIVAFITTSCSWVYGMLSGRLDSKAKLSRAITRAGRYVTPLLPLYIVTVEFIHSLLWVMGPAN